MQLKIWILQQERTDIVVDRDTNLFNFFFFVCIDLHNHPNEINNNLIFFFCEHMFIIEGLYNIHDSEAMKLNHL